MDKEVLFFHGGGSREDFEADQKLVDSLNDNLGSAYSIRYPFLAEENQPDFGRRNQIKDEIQKASDGVIIVGHSLGASMLLACLSEMDIARKINGIFLIATPFWSGDEEWVKAFKLRPDFAQKLDPKIPLFFYHCFDDEEVPCSHMNIYREHIPWAKFVERETGGHQFNNDLSLVADDIKSLG